MPGKDITEALTGRSVPPLDDQDRQDIELSKDYLQALASCYRTLAGRTQNEDRRAELRRQVGFVDDALRRLYVMDRVERHQILRNVPGLLESLRAEIERRPQ
jgi:hypothetical protein